MRLKKGRHLINLEKATVITLRKEDNNKSSLYVFFEGYDEAHIFSYNIPVDKLEKEIKLVLEIIGSKTYEIKE